MYDIAALYEAASVTDAIALLTAHPGAKIIAGGSDVLIKIRDGELAGCTLVSIQRLDCLRGVSLDVDGTLIILPLTSFSHIERDPLITRHMRVLGEAAGMVGGPQIRNIGTIGGNVCNGVVSADTASTLVAYDAVMEITGPNGVRHLPITEFYIKPGKVALAQNELLSAIRIPEESHKNTYGHYIKYAMRGAMDIATLGCSVNVRLSDDKKTIDRMRMAFGVAGPVPLRASIAESFAAGKPVSAATVNEAAEAALGDIRPRDSWRASKALRVQLARELAARAFTKAIELAGGAL